MKYLKGSTKTPRIKIVQKLYSHSLNPEIEITYQKSQFKKFIKDVTTGTIERNELIEENTEKYLGTDINLKRTDKLLKIVLFAAVYEIMFKHNNSINLIIAEYLKTAEFFLEKAQIKYLNAILDKISKLIRKSV